MNDRESFKFNFMARCIDNGLTTPAEMLTAVKQASASLEKKSDEGGIGEYLTLGALGHGLKGIGEGVGHIGSTMLSWGIPLALAAPPVAGAVAGHLMAKSQDVDDFDVDDAKNEELIDTYGREAAKLRRQGLIRRHLASAPRNAGRPMF